MIYVRALFYALLIPLAARRRWALTVPADVADVLLVEAADLGPVGRPWVEFLLARWRA